MILKNNFQGLRLVVDSQKLSYKSKKVHKQKNTGYKVFITIPGVVTHKVPFNVDPSFYGEYDFLAHGLHYITASTPFLEWNKEKKVCF